MDTKFFVIGFIVFAIFICSTLSFIGGFYVGRSTMLQSSFLSDNLTPATQEYLEAHPGIVDPNKR